MISKKLPIYLVIFCIVTMILCSLNGISIANASEQPDRTFSFVTEALQLKGASGGTTGGGEAPLISNATYKWITNWNYVYASQGANVSVYAEYLAEGKGLFYVAMNIRQSSTVLPLCAQPSINAVDRARDFLVRYQNWTQDANLTKIINTLSMVDARQNSSIAVDDLNLTVTSNPYLTSFYWGYTSNGTYSRGLGITFVSKYVFFRDDRNLLFPPREPPAMDFYLGSSYFLEMQSPEPYATNVPLNTDIQLLTDRPVEIIELYLNPEVNISEVITETRREDSGYFYNGYYTFKFEQLKPDTVYNVTVLYGQTSPSDIDSFSISGRSWSFTTGESIGTSFTTIILYVLAIIAVVVAVALVVFVLKKRNQSK